jgi:hypothetical protein
LELSQKDQQGGKEEKDDEFAPAHRLSRQTMVADGALGTVFGHIVAMGTSEFEELFHVRTPW